MADMQFIVGIDEVGRGPVAGPVAICAALASQDFLIAEAIPGVKDSKVLSLKKREAIFKLAEGYKDKGDLRYSVQYGSAKRVDDEGIEKVIRSLISDALEELHPPIAETQVFLDGRLKAPQGYMQETVIRGDSLIPMISLASVIAKVSRDRLMVNVANTYPEYGFESHKGYGTAKHLEAIRTHGLCPEHRTSYLTRVDGIIGA